MVECTLCRLFGDSGPSAVLGREPAAATAIYCRWTLRGPRGARLSFAAISTAVLGVTRSLDLFAKGAARRGPRARRNVAAKAVPTSRFASMGLAQHAGRLTSAAPGRVLRGARRAGAVNSAHPEVLSSRPAGPTGRFVAVAAMLLWGWPSVRRRQVRGCRPSVGRTTHGDPRPTGIINPTPAIESERARNGVAALSP